MPIESMDLTQLNASARRVAHVHELEVITSSSSQFETKQINRTGNPGFFRRRLGLKGGVLAEKRKSDAHDYISIKCTVLDWNH